MTLQPASDRHPTLADSPRETLREVLASAGLVLDLGALRVRVRSKLPELAVLLSQVYAAFPLATDPMLVDTTVDLLPASGPRRWLRPLARVEIDGIDPFGPFPRAQSLPHFEWALNWAFANMMNAHLLLHSGALEIDGKGVLLIARPGSGKSTLSAGLMARGARLLSDEFGVVRTSDTMLLPMVKPVALKNRSIEVMRNWDPDGRMGPTFLNTRKGNLAHQAVRAESVRSVHQPARPALVLFPRFQERGNRSLTPVAQARAFMELAANSFNYELLGATGFETVSRLVDQCACFRFEYSDMQDAVGTVLELCGSKAAVDARVTA